jgi:hypothetical protein
MSWHCIIVINSDSGERETSALVVALETAYREAGQPADARVFVNRGSAARCTLLLSPEASRMANDMLDGYGAIACDETPRLHRYAALPL